MKEGQRLSSWPNWPLFLGGSGPTNAFSKKLENHAAAVALYFMYYNFVRVHQTLRCTPAMVAGVTTKRLEIGDIVALLDQKSSAHAAL